MGIHRLKNREYIFTEMPKISDININKNDARIDPDEKPILACSSYTKAKGNTHYAIPVQWWVLNDSTIKIQASGEMHLDGGSGSREEVTILVDNSIAIKDILQNGKIFNITCDYSENKNEDKNKRNYFPRFDLLGSKKADRNKHQLLDYLFNRSCFSCRIKPEYTPKIGVKNVEFDFRSHCVDVPLDDKSERLTLKGKPNEVMFKYSREKEIGIISVGGVPLSIYRLENYGSYNELYAAACVDAARMFDLLDSDARGEVIYRR